MSNTMFLLIPVLLTVAGLVAMWLLRRRPQSMRSGMETFSRELDALRPIDARPPASDTHIMRVDRLEPASAADEPAPGES